MFQTWKKREMSGTKQGSWTCSYDWYITRIIVKNADSIYYNWYLNGNRDELISGYTKSLLSAKRAVRNAYEKFK